ncbi:MAG: DNA glycosylase [Methanoculleus sp. SDB]|nr:MAG: DNA glycosylase [Methanoculleus sp. SDB]
MHNSDYQIKINKIRKQLIIWSSGNLRDFPWRNTRDLYEILIAEIMLHRTKADQVERLYTSFIRKFPDIQSIASEKRENLINELKSLGLTWRADLLHELAQNIVRDYEGKIPLKKEKIAELPGIGHYIASAILCLAFNKPEPMVDTNTVRVIGRVFGIPVTDSSRRSKKFHDIMRDLVNFENPRLFSFTMIDLAALVCIAGKYPHCEICPLNEICIFFRDEPD